MRPRWSWGLAAGKFDTIANQISADIDVWVLAC